MDLVLTRKDYNSTGIYSELTDSNGSHIAVTLEHAYLMGDPTTGYTYISKIPPGKYTCVRGPHRLHGMTQDFTTFEITGVAGHANLLFHWGNWNKDSEGCILLGEKRLQDMITNSRVTFNKFMDLQKDVDTFILTVM